MRAADLVVRNFCVGEALSIPLLRGSWHAAGHPLLKAALRLIVKFLKVARTSARFTTHLFFTGLELLRRLVSWCPRHGRTSRGSTASRA